MIKIATIEDLDTILRMADQFVWEIQYGHITSSEKIKAVAEEVLSANKKEKIVILFDDIGILAGVTTPLLFSDALIATELMWWVHPDHRKKDVGFQLLKTFEYWASQVGAKFVSMTSVDERVGKFYEANGYALYERVYFKEI